MNKQLAFSKWIVSFFVIVVTILLVLSGVAYIIDPFFQFRVRDNAYMLNGWFVGSGLIKNYDYDMLILGSSMTQNFDMDLIREKLGVEPLHVGLGGVNTLEMKELVNLAYTVDKADYYYICVDLFDFAKNAETSRNLLYLFKSDILSSFHYLLSYEVWFRYIPVDVGFMIVDMCGGDLPQKFVYSRKIDRLEDWRLDFTFGEDVVLENYNNAIYSVSEIDTDDLYNRMTAHIDQYFSGFDFQNGEHIFFFPPYSALFWYDAQEKGYFDSYLQAKQYFVKKSTMYDVTVYDFQHANFIIDLDNYKDTTHYTPRINDWMVESFAEDEYVVTEENSDEFQERLRENVDAFRERYVARSILQRSGF